MADHHFYLKANWPGNRNDVGTIESGNLITSISIPKEMDGREKGPTQMKCFSGGSDLLHYYTCSDDGEKRAGKRRLTDGVRRHCRRHKRSLYIQKIIHRPLSCLNMMLHKTTSHWRTSFVKKRSRHA